MSKLRATASLSILLQYSYDNGLGLLAYILNTKLHTNWSQTESAGQKYSKHSKNITAVGALSLPFCINHPLIGITKPVVT